MNPTVAITTRLITQGSQRRRCLMGVIFGSVRGGAGTSSCSFIVTPVASNHGRIAANRAMRQITRTLPLLLLFALYQRSWATSPEATGRIYAAPGQTARCSHSCDTVLT